MRRFMFFWCVGEGVEWVGGGWRVRWGDHNVLTAPIMLRFQISCDHFHYSNLLWATFHVTPLTFLMLRCWFPYVYVNTLLMVRCWLSYVCANTLLMVRRWLSYVYVNTLLMVRCQLSYDCANLLLMARRWFSYFLLTRCWWHAVDCPMFMLTRQISLGRNTCTKKTDKCSGPCCNRVASKARSPTIFEFHSAVQKGMRRWPYQSVT